METRPVIDQARGMVMALVPCPAPVAWEILVETSQHTNIKLREVAAHLVATTSGTEIPDGIGRELAAAFHRRRTRPRQEQPAGP